MFNYRNECFSWFSNRNLRSVGVAKCLLFERSSDFAECSWGHPLVIPFVCNEFACRVASSSILAQRQQAFKRSTKVHPVPGNVCSVTEEESSCMSSKGNVCYIASQCYINFFGHSDEAIIGQMVTSTQVIENFFGKFHRKLFFTLKSVRIVFISDFCRSVYSYIVSALGLGWKFVLLDEQLLLDKFTSGRKSCTPKVLLGVYCVEL